MLTNKIFNEYLNKTEMFYDISHIESEIMKDSIMLKVRLSDIELKIFEKLLKEYQELEILKQKELIDFVIKYLSKN